METTPINTMEISSPLTSFQQSALEDAEKNLEKLRKEVEEAKYLVDLSKNELTSLSNFIVNNAPWKFTESLGIIEVEKSMKRAVKEGKLYTDAVAIEAIYYYLSKVEGNGKNTNASAIASIDEYLKILKSITGAIERIKANTERVRQAEFVVAARREGIEPDKSLTTDN
jgi:archaellum component FlaC